MPKGLVRNQVVAPAGVISIHRPFTRSGYSPGMTSIEPLLPHPGDDRDQIGTTDPGRGAPPPAPGTGVSSEEPDQVDAEAADQPTGDPGPPSRTPQPGQLRTD